MASSATAPGRRPLKVFFSYARQDQAMRDKLASHLAALENANLINRWHDRQIVAGDNWQDQIDNHLEDADLILLLISNNFMASRYCYGKEMTRALERSKAGTVIVIPMLLREVVWSQAPTVNRTTNRNLRAQMRRLPSGVGQVTGSVIKQRMNEKLPESNFHPSPRQW
jgi:hypothetical protein